MAVALVAIVAVAASAGLGVALLLPKPKPKLRLLSDAECLEGARNLRLYQLGEFFELDPGDPRLAQRGQQIRGDFKRVLAIELTDADLERIRTETLAAWLRRKEEARLLLSRYVVHKPTQARLDQVALDSRALLKKFGEDDFRAAARISKEQYEKLREDASRQR